MKKSVLLSALVAAVLLGAVAYATAGSATYVGAGGPPRAASGTVTVNATVNPKLTLTIDAPGAGQTVDFPVTDPGVLSGTQTVNLKVSSNKNFDVRKTVVDGGPLGLKTTLLESDANAKTAETLFSDDYTIQVPWTTEAGTYAATVQYTVTQSN